MAKNIEKGKSYYKILFESLNLLSKSEKSKILLFTIIQMASSLLDLAGVALFGVLGALAVFSTNGTPTGDRLNFALTILQIESQGVKTQLVLIGLLAFLLFTVKTLLSIYFTRRFLSLLSMSSSKISSLLFRSIFLSPYQAIQSVNSQEINFAIRWGSRATIVGIIGATSALISDIFLSAILFIGLFLVDPIIAVITGVIFTSIGIILYKIFGNRARYLGAKEAALSIEIDRNITEIFGSLKELIVRRRIGYFDRKISKNLNEIAQYQFEQAFMPFVGKYVIEGSIVISTFTVILIQFLMQSPERAISTILLFFAASSRIAPSVLRVQHNLMTIKSNAGVAESTIKLISSFDLVHINETTVPKFNDEYNNFNSEISICDLSYRYPNASTNILSNLSLDIKKGQFIGIVGSSGAGKTTLANLILGLLEPTSGEIKISGISPKQALNKWPGAVEYVPQDTFIANSSIRENVTFGFSKGEISDEKVKLALSKASLDNFMKNQNKELTYQSGESGNRLSGGEKQRLGIARALVTKPKILILDESTSSLDAHTEKEITEMLENFSGELTIIVIAHRLSILKNADKIVYLEKGEKLAEGTFEELKNTSMKFSKLLKLMQV